LDHRESRTHHDQPPTATTNDCRVTEYSYDSVSGSGDSPTVKVGKPRTIYELIRGEIVGKTMHSYPTEYLAYTQVASSSGAAWDDGDNEKSFSIEDAEHRLTFAGYPDGTGTTNTYTDNGTGRLTTTCQGAQSLGFITDGSRTEEQVDFLGRTVSRKTYELDTGILIAEELYSAPDDFWRPTQVRYLDATTNVTVKQDCCNAAYTIDRDGIASTNSYDALKRLVSTTRLGITTSNILDAAGRTLAQVRKGTDGSLITLRTLGYDASNRVIRETNALGAVTSYSYVVDGSSQSVVTTTNADGGTRIETRFRDGQSAPRTGCRRAASASRS
jgi:YD repeat-containing protein